MRKENNNQLMSSRSVGMRDINALLTAPISRIKTLRDDEGQSINVAQALPDNNIDCHAEKSLLSISYASHKQGRDPRLQASGMTTNLNNPPHGKVANFNAPSPWREGAVPEGLYPGVPAGQVRGKIARGFTLIELLVVVLIIGILAAIALPQYQLAVAKSRYASLVVWGKALRDAQEVYYLTHGEYATEITDLDISLPTGTKETSLWGSKAWQMPDGVYVRLLTESVIVTEKDRLCNNYGIYHEHGTNGSLGKAYCVAHTSASCNTALGRKICISLGGEREPSVTSNEQYWLH